MFVITDDDHPILIDLYDRKYQQYYAVAFGIIHQQDAAQDAVQQGFLKFIDIFHEKKEMPLEDMERYLLTIVRNISRRYMKDRGREVHWDDIEDYPQEDDVFSRMEQACDEHNVRRALKEIPARTADFLTMRYVDHRSDAEIAAVLEVHPKSVPVMRHRAKHTLRKALKKMEGV